MSATKARFIFIFLAVLCSNAHSSEVLNSIPNFFLTPAAMTLEDMILGRTCYSMQTGAAGLNCNPAFLAFEEKSQFRFNVYADDEVDDVVDAYKELTTDGSDLTTTEKLLNRQGPVVARAFTSMWYQKEWWAVSFTPFRLGFASRVNQGTAPTMATHFVKQTELSIRAGLPFAADPRLRFGLQLRYLGQEFARGEFLVADALADPELIPLEDHQLIALEPGMVYVFSEDPWQPTLALMVTNIEVYRQGSKAADSEPQGEIGFGSKPAFAKGRLSTSTHLTLGHEIREVTKRLRLGFSYDVGFANFVVSLAQDEFGAGVSASINALNLAFGYKTEEFGADHRESKPWDGFMAEVGLVF